MRPAEWESIMQAEDLDSDPREGQAASGALVVFPRSFDCARELTKKQVAVYLGVSTRFIEYRMQEGLPSQLRFGRRYYRLDEVQPWLKAREERQRALLRASNNSMKGIGQDDYSRAAQRGLKRHSRRGQCAGGRWSR